MYAASPPIFDYPASDVPRWLGGGVEGVFMVEGVPTQWLRLERWFHGAKVMSGCCF